MAQLNHFISSVSQERLEKLIEERLKPGVSKESIDKRIWDLFGETWAVMFTDLSGFSRQVAEFGIIHFLQIIYESRRLFLPCIEAHDGILIKEEGDSMMIIFRRPAKALQCALDMQKAVQEYSQDKAAEEKIMVCLGLGYGPMLKIGDDDVFGNEVNASSKLGEDIAGPDEILVTDSFKKAVEEGKELTFSQIDEKPPGGECAFKLEYDF